MPSLEQLECRIVPQFTPLTNAAPVGLGSMFLLSNGQVLVDGGTNSAGTGEAYYTLSPDASGNYVDGTWTQVASSNYTRLYSGSAILKNGNLIVSGGEYGNGGAQAEIYNPVANTWTTTPQPNGGNSMSDDESTILPNGNYMAQSPFGAVDVYNPSTNTWSTTGSPLAGGDEEDWVQQPDGSILKIDGYGDTTSERYIPSLGQWYSMGTVPNNPWSSNGEIGPGMLLPNGKTIFFGASGLTDIYTPGPAGSTAPGTWAGGPNLPGGVLPDDAPAVELPDGNVLISGDTGSYNGPTSIAEYNPNTNSIALISSPSISGPAFTCRILMLPNGQALLNDGGTTAWVYSEGGSIPASSRPTVSSIHQNSDGSFLLTGTQLNGISEGSGYGDDYRPSSNYPIVELVASNGNVYYGRTYNWTSTGVQTGDTAVSTDFAVPGNVPSGTYTLYAVANGIASNGVSFTLPFNKGGAAQVNLASAFNRVGIVNDGSTFSTGLDGGGSAYSANLLGSSFSFGGNTYALGTPGSNNDVSGAGQTITLPTGYDTTLSLLGTAVNGNQANQTFTVTYADNSTQTFTQSLSDWFTPQGYSGETIASTMAYRDVSNGTKDDRTFDLYAYSFNLNAAKQVKSITLPNNSNVEVLAIDVTPAPVVQVNLSGSFNRTGIEKDGATFSSSGGLDNGGDAYSASLLGSSVSFGGNSFVLGPAGSNDVISAAGQTITLPAGTDTVLTFLAAAVDGNQANQTFTVTYSDGSTANFTQSFSDWFTPQGYSGESKAVTMSYRDVFNGTKDNRTFYLYDYSFALNSAKTVKSIKLPSNGNLEILAIDLIDPQKRAPTGPR
jgi:hypothetical protein